MGAQLNVGNLAVILIRKHIDQDFLVGQGLKRDGRNKPGCMFCHDHVDLMAR